MADDNDKTVQFPQNPTQKVLTTDGCKRVTGGFQPTNDGWQPLEKGYKPTATVGQQTSPPQGGSGVPAKPQQASGIAQAQSGDKEE